MNAWIEETYFQWLSNEAFSRKDERRQYEGCLRVLHDIPFYWTIWLDENRAGDAMAFRQHEFLNYQQDLDTIDQVWLGNWATASPSVLEVMLGMARRWHFYFEGPVSFYFGHMFRNMALDRFPGKVLTGRSQENIRVRVDDWLSRQFKQNGVGSPFPVTHAFNIIDMTKLDIWSQMNAYSAEHFQ